jgi:hypothetical protein
LILIMRRIDLSMRISYVSHFLSDNVSFESKELSWSRWVSWMSMKQYFFKRGNVQFLIE